MPYKQCCCEQFVLLTEVALCMNKGAPFFLGGGGGGITLTVLRCLSDHHRANESHCNERVTEISILFCTTGFNPRC